MSIVFSFIPKAYSKRILSRIIRRFVPWTGLLLLAMRNAPAQTELIVPGGDWRDTEGNVIVATEGGIIRVDDLYYLWGMYRGADNYTFEGIDLYSSPDLKNWTYVNRILSASSHPDLDNGAVVERAKLLHNEHNGTFVMWMHFEGQNAYSTAEVGYATCEDIGGDYTFHEHFRPLDIDSRDINVYKDDDGKAYLICTTEGNQSVSLFELDENYTGIVREVFRGSARNNMECEGHAIIKTGEYYFWLMSWCTGWDFNDNHYFYSRSLEGPWESGGNIAVSTTHTYESQVGFAVTVEGSEETTFLYTGDRWAVRNFSMSRVVLLPIEISGTDLSVRWHDQWNIDVQTGQWSAGSKNFIDGIYTISPKHSGLTLGTSGSAVRQQAPDGGENQLWRVQNIGASHFKISSVAGGKVMDISGASRETGAKLLQYDWSDAYNQKWHILDCGNGYHRFVNVNTLGKTLEIENGSHAEGSDAVLGEFAYQDHQLWRIRAVNEHIETGVTYMIENRASKKVIDAGPSGDNSPIVQSSSTSSAAQAWRFDDLFNGYYSITSASDAAALDNNNSVENVTSVSTAESTGCYSQQWQIVRVDDEYYKVVNRISGKVLDNKDGSAAEGNPVIQYSDYAESNTNQQWRFVRTDVVASKSDKTPKSIAPYRSRYVDGAVLYDLQGRAVRSHPHGEKAGKILSHGVYLVKEMQGTKVRRHLIVDNTHPTRTKR